MREAIVSLIVFATWLFGLEVLTRGEDSVERARARRSAAWFRAAKRAKLVSGEIGVSSFFGAKLVSVHFSVENWWKIWNETNYPGAKLVSVHFSVEN